MFCMLLSIDMNGNIDVSERNFQGDGIKYWYGVGIILEFSECYMS